MSLLVFLVLFGLGLQRRAANAPDRARSVIRAFHPDAHATAKNTLEFTAHGRRIVARFTEGPLQLSVKLPNTPLPWWTAARALGDGATLALLAEPRLTVTDDTANIALDTARLNTRGFRVGLTQIAAVATRLEGLSLPDALARHLLDRAPPESRLGFFLRLTADYPDAPITYQCALSCATEQEQPDLRAAAVRWLQNTQGANLDESA